MKYSRSDKNSKLIISPEDFRSKMSKKNKTEKLLPPYSFPLHTHRQILTSDPFREIRKGNPKSKLCPIILTKKLSPGSGSTSNRISIRLPELAEDGRLKPSKCSLYLFENHEPASVKKLDSITESRKILRVTSEKAFRSKIFTNSSIKLTDKTKVSDSSSRLEVSFGNINESVFIKRNLINND